MQQSLEIAEQSTAHDRSYAAKNSAPILLVVPHITRTDFVGGV